MIRDTASAYDRWAEQYDDTENPTRDLDATVVRASALRVDGKDVLELGCGTGKNTVWLSERAQNVTALDFSAGMLDVARRRVPGTDVRFVQHDIRECWPVADNSVDLVIGNLVLEHVLELQPVYAEARRVMRRHGQLFLCELHPYEQLSGSQARFTDPDTTDIIRVTAFVHSTSEYVSAGLEAGFALRQLGEWRDPGSPEGGVPRLLSLLFEAS